MAGKQVKSRPQASQAPEPTQAEVGRTNWNYHERSEDRKGVISEWIRCERLTVKAQARLERALDQLRQLCKTSWSKPAPASNIGNHTYVIRFKEVSGAQLRIFGHFYDAHGSFVMTSTGYEKDDDYYPKNYTEIAKRHKKSCDESFSATTIPYANYCEICKRKEIASYGRGEHLLR